MARRLNVDSDTLALFRLDEVGGGTAIDLSENNCDATNVGSTVVTGITGMPFTIARQVGPSKSLSFPNSSQELEPANISIECWVRLDSTPGSSQYIVLRSNGDGYGLGVNTSRELFLLIRDSSDATQTLTGDTALDLDTWYHVAGTYENGKMRLFLNGVQDGYQAIVATGGIWYDETAPLLIGRPSGGIAGQVADVRISSVARPIWHFTNTYNAVDDPQAGLSVQSGESLLVWNMDDILGTTINDDAENLDGTILGTIANQESPVSVSGIVLDTNSSNYVSVAHDPDLNFAADKTIEFWYTPLATATHDIFSKSGGADYWYCSLDTAGRAKFVIRDGSQAVSMQPTDSIPDSVPVGQASHIALTYNHTDKTMKLYVNGVLKTTLTSGTFISCAPTGALWVGRRATSGANGILHSWRVSNTEKTAEEIYETFHGSNIVEDN